MTEPSDFLRAAGAILFGSRWQAALAAELGVSSRTVRRWSTGAWPIPAGRVAQVRALLEARGVAIAELLAA